MYIFCVFISLLSYIFFITIQMLIFSNLIIKIGSPVCSFICLLSGFISFVINPGVIYNYNYNNSKNNIENKKKFYCSSCKYNYPDQNKRWEHCDVCGICMMKVDHHCDVFGKCIAKRNLCCFYIFVLTTFIMIGMTIITILYLIYSIEKKKK